MTFAKSERVDLCDLLLQVGPDAATLCEGWDTHDLAAHLWIRETDPLAATGMLAKPLSGLLERRMAETRQRWEFPELVGKIRTGPARFSVFAIPGVDEPANTTEFFVHHEDVRRGGAKPLHARELAPEIEDWMWRRLKLLGRAFFRRVPVGVVLERAAPVPAAAEQDLPSGSPDTSSSDTGSSDLGSSDAGSPEPNPGAVRADTIRAVPGADIVTLVGRPSELLLFAHGRASAADVTVVGEPETVQALHEAELHV